MAAAFFPCGKNKFDQFDELDDLLTCVFGGLLLVEIMLKSIAGESLFDCLCPHTDSLSHCVSHCVSLTDSLPQSGSHCLALTASLVDGFLWVLPTIVKEELNHAKVVPEPPAQPSASVAPEPHGIPPELGERPGHSDVTMEVRGAPVSLLYLFASGPVCMYCSQLALLHLSVHCSPD